MEHMPVAHYVQTGTQIASKSRKGEESGEESSKLGRDASYKRVPCSLPCGMMRQVAVLSSNCNPNEQITAQRRIKTTPHVKEVEIPGPVHLYNHSMGGVDLNDQYRSYYPIWTFR